MTLPITEFVIEKHENVWVVHNKLFEKIKEFFNNKKNTSKLFDLSFKITMNDDTCQMFYVSGASFYFRRYYAHIQILSVKYNYTIHDYLLMLDKYILNEKKYKIELLFSKKKLTSDLLRLVYSFL